MGVRGAHKFLKSNKVGVEVSWEELGRFERIYVDVLGAFFMKLREQLLRDPIAGGVKFWTYVKEYFASVRGTGVPVIFVLDSGAKTLEKSLGAGRRAARRGKVEAEAVKSIVRLEQAAASKGKADVTMDDRRQYRRIIKKERRRIKRLHKKLFLFTPALAAYLLESSGDLDVVIAPAEVRVYFECCICFSWF
jgi:hypothetical protein